MWGFVLTVGALLILRAGLRMLRKMEKKPLPLLLFGLSCAAMLAINCFSLRFSTIWLLLIAGLIGFAACLLRERRDFRPRLRRFP